MASANHFKRRLLFLVLAIFIGTTGFLTYAIVQGNMLGTIPHFAVQKDGTPIDPAAPLSLGKNGALSIMLTNPASALCNIEASATQNNQTHIIYQNAGGKTALLPVRQDPKQLEFPISVSALFDKGFRDGPVTLSISAEDCSVRHRQMKVTPLLTIDVTPPRVGITSTQHYINQGGADLATYTVSADTVWSGIRVGSYEFRGYPLPGATDNSTERFALFVFSYELPESTPIEVIAIDAAGNEAKATLRPARFFPKEFRHREIPIDDTFITTKIADVIANTPDLANQNDPLKNFLLVNSELRKKNAAFLVDLAKLSEERFFWKDAFRPLINAAVEANFADYRAYLYNGQKVDNQVHLGFDLAAYEKHPILASASGKVIYADYLGIYGNAVILDHGYGLMTLYGHLSSIDVKKGDLVAQDQKIGNSGTTGLAAGDHLHYSMMIQGVQTNPIEFWDQHWIDDHVYLRINKTAFGQPVTTTSALQP